MPIIIKTMKPLSEKRSTRESGVLTLDNASLAEIEVLYADRTINAKTRAALNEGPKRVFKSAAEALRSLKAPCAG